MPIRRVLRPELPTATAGHRSPLGCGLMVSQHARDRTSQKQALPLGPLLRASDTGWFRKGSGFHFLAATIEMSSEYEPAAPNFHRRQYLWQEFSRFEACATTHLKWPWVRS